MRPFYHLDISLYSKSSKAKVDDLFAVCEVEGMEEPIFLSIKADVNGLEVEYSTPNVIGDEIR